MKKKTMKPEEKQIVEEQVEQLNKVYEFMPEFADFLISQLGNHLSYEEMLPIINTAKAKNLPKESVEAFLNHLAKYPYNRVNIIMNKINNFLLVK